jgi:hypothetical protein
MFHVQSQYIDDWMQRRTIRHTCETMAQAQSKLATLDTMPGAVRWSIVHATYRCAGCGAIEKMTQAAGHDLCDHCADSRPDEMCLDDGPIHGFDY